MSLKTVTFWKNYCSIMGLSLKICLKSQVLFFFNKNRLKKHAVPNIGNRYVLWKLSFYYMGFPEKMVWNPRFLFFWIKKHLKNKFGFNSCSWWNYIDGQTSKEKVLPVARRWWKLPLPKKHLKNKMYLSKKRLHFGNIVVLFYKSRFLKIGLNSHVLFFFDQKQAKITRCT